MARTRRRWPLVAVVTAVTTITTASAAPAQSPAPDPDGPRTVTVIGTGTVKPTPRDRTSNASIRRAVQEAERAAIPRAIGNGQGRAARLAELSGLRLVALHSVAETSPSPFGWPGPFGAQGTFGPDRYCGTVAVIRRGRDGKRRRVGSRRTCRVPAQITATLTMTFTAA